MKAILMPIHPEWVAKILNGEKTIEIRKTMPKCKLPVDVYIYCTKGGEENLIHNRNGWSMSEFAATYVNGERVTHNYKGKVVAKFTLREIIKWRTHEYLGGTKESDERISMRILKESCLSAKMLDDYLGLPDKFYAWCVSDLVVFDKPKELSEFRYKKVTMKWDENYHRRIVKKEIIPVKRPPQSWQYVDVEVPKTSI